MRRRRQGVEAVEVVRMESQIWVRGREEAGESVGGGKVVRWKVRGFHPVPGSNVAPVPYIKGDVFIPSGQDRIGSCIGRL